MDHLDYLNRELFNPTPDLFGFDAPEVDKGDKVNCYGRYIITLSHDNGQYYLDRFIKSMVNHNKIKLGALNLNVPKSRIYEQPNSEYCLRPYLFREDINDNSYVRKMLSIYNNKYVKLKTYRELYYKKFFELLRDPTSLESHQGIDDINIAYDINGNALTLDSTNSVYNPLTLIKKKIIDKFEEDEEKILSTESQVKRNAPSNTDKLDLSTTLNNSSQLSPYSQIETNRKALRKRLYSKKN